MKNWKKKQSDAVQARASRHVDEEAISHSFPTF